MKTQSSNITDMHPNHKEIDVSKLKKVLQVYSSLSEFKDNTWYLNIVQKPGSSLTNTTLYFSKCPSSYRSMIKNFAIILLAEKYASARTISSVVFETITFCKYLENFHSSIKLSKVKKNHVAEYISFLDKKYAYETKIKLYRSLRVFFKTMRDFEEMPSKSPLLVINPYPRLRKNIVNNTEKMIPEYVTNQVDQIFRNEKIPLHVRLAYWILRSIPSRISEITGMQLDCILPALRPNCAILKIPTWKQNGGYLEPENRLIEIKNEGHGAYLLSLLKQQQYIAKEYQEAIRKVEDKDLLFIYKVEYMEKSNTFHLDKSTQLIQRKTPIVCTERNLTLHFNKVCKDYDVKTEDNISYKFSSHQLRHNGITDRIYFGFNLDDVREMTNHKGSEMLVRNYIHINNEELQKKQDKIYEITNDLQVSQNVFFKGNILKSVDQEQRVLKSPRAGRLGGIGICSDMLGCSNPSECLQCLNFMPDSTRQEYFEAQIELWSKKAHLFSRNPIWKDHAINNINAYQNIVNKIKMREN